MSNLLVESMRLSYPRPENFPEPRKYYREAKSTLVPDTRSLNNLETIERELENLGKQSVFPVIPWVYVQLQAMSEWNLRSAYVAGILRVTNKSWDRWCRAKEDGLNALWKEAAAVLPSVKAAREAVSQCVDSFNTPSRPPTIPEPEDHWPLCERNWFVRSVTSRVACSLASLGGLRPQDFPPDATPEDVARKMEARCKVHIVRSSSAPASPFFGRIWTPSARR